jgi:ankyrin repeat protein
MTVDFISMRFFRIYLNNSPLLEASRKGSLEEVIRLVEDGHDIHQDNEGPMFTACFHGHRKVLDYLIEKGANIRLWNDAVLHCAASCGHTELVKFFLDKGLDIHSENNCALACALAGNHNETVEFLLKRGASVKVYNHLSSYLSSRSGTVNKKAMFLTTPDTVIPEDETQSWSVYRKCQNALKQICTWWSHCPWHG